MERATLKQWMSEAGLNGREDADGFLIVTRGNLEISAAYMAEEGLVVIFTPILELAGLDDAQRLEVMSQALTLNGVGSLPLGCALSYEEDGEVVFLLWQQSPEQLGAAGFANAFGDFEKAAAQVQEHLQDLLAEEEEEIPAESGAQDFVIKA